MGNVSQKAVAAPAEPSLEQKVGSLRTPEAYPAPRRPIDVIETHMSWVFLAGERVYKLKKPVRYAFLDFSTLEARRLNCEREVQLNRRLAADVYYGSVPLVAKNDGALQIDGRGRIVDWLVAMRRLPADRMLDAAIRADRVSADDIRRLAGVLVAFYRQSAPVELDAAAYRARFEADIRGNRAELLAPQYALSAEQVERISAAQSRFLETRSAVLEERARGRKIVDAHGDLRPEHICLTDEPRIIDCLEFNRAFRLLDPVDELAYLAMECERLGAPAVGEAVLRHYLDATGDTPPDALVWFYKTFRACLRAKIAIWHIADHEVREIEKWRGRASDYLAVAERCSVALLRT